MLEDLMPVLAQQSNFVQQSFSHVFHIHVDLFDKDSLLLNSLVMRHWVHRVKTKNKQ
jgi:hypothetical protein